VQHLRRHSDEERARTRRRETLARLDTAGDPEALREMQQLLSRAAPVRAPREEPA